MALGGIRGFYAGVSVAVAASVSVVIFCTASSAREIEKINFPEKLDLGAQKLELHGVGLRTTSVEGARVKVYVAALYTSLKSTSADELIASQQPKVLRLIFLRGVEKSKLREAWTTAFANNCKYDCAVSNTHLKMFNDFMIDIKAKGELKLRFDEDGVTVEIIGAEKTSGHISSEAFRKNLLSIFIGEHPPTAELKRGLLGSTADVK